MDESTQTPCSDYVPTNGVIYFARMLGKVRLRARGRLADDYNLGCANPHFFDARLCRFLGLDYEALVQPTLEGGTDEEILEWCFQTTRRPNSEEILYWNSFTEKRGWRDESSKSLQAATQAHPSARRVVIQTWVDLHDVDKGRVPESARKASGGV